jgi:hypothetical protein
MPEVSSDETWIITFEEIRAYRRLEWTLNAAVIVAALVFLVCRLALGRQWNDDSLGAWFVLLPYITWAAAALLTAKRRRQLRVAVNERFRVEFMLRTRSEFPDGLNVLDVKKTVPGLHPDGTVTIWQLKRKGATFHLRRS